MVYRPILGEAPLARMSLIYRSNDQSPSLRNFIQLAQQLVAQAEEAGAAPQPS